MTSDDDEWVGFVSGLEMGSSTPTDAQLQMLTEYLTGEEGGEEDQLGAARISRLIIAGNSVTASALADRIETPSYAERKAVRFFFRSSQTSDLMRDLPRKSEDWTQRPSKSTLSTNFRRIYSISLESCLFTYYLDQKTHLGPLCLSNHSPKLFLVKLQRNLRLFTRKVILHTSTLDLHQKRGVEDRS